MRTPPLILLVDDSADDRALYRDHLVACGFAVETAADGHEAVLAAQSMVPDLVLMDLEMPLVDGWSAARQLKSLACTKAIPIIALSGFHDAAVVMRAISMGCIQFVPKPCFAEDLKTIIRVTLEKG
jgi:two-component system cell cycle response regulator DivK